MNRDQVRKRFLPIAAIAASIGIVIAMMAAVLTVSPVSAQTMAAHPAHIHTGACPAPGKIVYPLSDVSSTGFVQGTPMASSAATGQANTLPVEESVTTVNAKLSALADGNHAIVIHESMANIGTYLVCGNIGGTLVGSNSLSFGLSPVNNSGYVGVANLYDNGDGTTTVYLFLLQSPANGASNVAASPTSSPVAAQPTQAATMTPTKTATAAATMAATQTATAAATTAATTQPATAATTAAGASSSGVPTAVTLQMVDIAFQPTEFTIPANTDVTVTLNNTGATAHNFSVTDHNNANVKNLGISVDVAPGQTQTVTVNAPAGDYYFFCNVPGHEAAGMHGTMHVK